MSSSSDSSHGDHPVTPTVKTPEKGNDGGTKEVVMEENLAGSSSDPDATLPSSQLWDK